MTSLLAAPLAFALGVMVFFHELGHFVVARLHGVRCLTFAFGFGPKLLQTKRGDTVYCICAIPLGGYVKMAGAGEGPDDKPEGKDDEFLSKTRWQRFQILIAGPVMNIILAVVILAVVLYQGAQVHAYESQPPVVGSVADDSPAAAAGIRVGDRILRVAGREVDTWEELVYAVVPRADREIDVVLRREGGVQTVQVTPAAQGRYDSGDLGVGPVATPQVVSMMSTTSSAAQEAGIRVGDVIEAVEGRAVTTELLMETIQASPDIPLTLRIRRDGVHQDIVVTPQLVDDVGLIGVGLSSEMRIIEPGPLEAFAMSLEQNYETSGLLFQTLWGLLTRDTPASQLAGPVGHLTDVGSSRASGVARVLRVHVDAQPQSGHLEPAADPDSRRWSHLHHGDGGGLAPRLQRAAQGADSGRRRGPIADRDSDGDLQRPRPRRVDRASHDLALGHGGCSRSQK